VTHVFDHIRRSLQMPRATAPADATSTPSVDDVTVALTNLELYLEGAQQAATGHQV
jgi:hypothetical protein